MSKVIIPITEKNRQGIDDLLESLKAIFGDFTVTEAYIIDTQNTGILSVARALEKKAADSGNGFYFSRGVAKTRISKPKRNRKGQPEEEAQEDEIQEDKEQESITQVENG